MLQHRIGSSTRRNSDIDTEIPPRPAVERPMTRYTSPAEQRIECGDPRHYPAPRDCPAIPENFSIFLEGPLCRLLRRLGVQEDRLEHVRNQALCVLPLAAWLPLVVLSAIGGQLFGGNGATPFLWDLEAHARLLVALPLLIVAENVAERRTRRVLQGFLQRQLIPPDAMPRFEAVVASALRLCRSIPVDALIIAFVYGVGILVIWRQYVALNTATWYSAPEANGSRLSLAGMWYGYVSLPIFQFLLLRWYFRLFVWARFLGQVSRIDLKLIPTHPDRLGGLSFLLAATGALVVLASAHGVLLAGWLATRVLVLGVPLTEFKIEIAAMVIFVLCITLGPLLSFAGPLFRTKRRGIRKYGTLAARYVREFDMKWLRGDIDVKEPLIGSPDIQSLADMGNSYSVVSSMRSLPITREIILHIAVATLWPVAPLLLTLMPLEAILAKLVGIIL